MVYDHTTRVPMMIRGPGIPAGSMFSGPASMADLAPTMMELAGATPAETAQMDGMSFAKALHGAAQPWKDAVLVECKPARLTADHVVGCRVLSAHLLTTQVLSCSYADLSIRPSNTISAAAPAAEREEYLSAFGYRTDDDGTPQYPWDLAPVDPEANYHWHDGPNNTFSALRVINATSGVDLLYAEFADVLNPLAWDFAPDQLNFFELYDVSKDYYMMNNLYPTASASVKAALHTRLQTLIKCKGVAECTAGLTNSPPVDL